MELPKQNQYMILYVSFDNPLLRRAVHFAKGAPLDREITQDEREELTGVTRQTPENWATGPMDKDTANGVFETTLAYLEAAHASVKDRPRYNERDYQSLRASIARYAVAYEDPAFEIYDAAQMLGMSANLCQQVIDAAIYERRPLLPSVWYPSEKKIGPEDTAKRDLERYEGAYLMWVRRGTIWLQCPLRVRYLQQQKKGGVRFIRCKLNFPMIEPDKRTPPYWEFDGFLAIRPHKLYWTFEKRQRERHDFFSFITDVAGPPGTPVSVAGRYLTTGQDAEQTIVTDDLYIEHMFSDKEDPFQFRYRDLMWNEAKVISEPDAVQKVTQRWEWLSKKGGTNSPLVGVPVPT